MTKLKGFQFERFSDDIYPSISKQDLNSNNLSFFGRNKTGKTITFNAFKYTLLGSGNVKETDVGTGNKVEIILEDSSRFERTSSGKNWEKGQEELESEKAEEKLNTYIGDAKLLDSFFISQIQSNLPLNRLSGSQRLSLIRKVTNNQREDRIQEYQETQEELEKIINDRTDEVRIAREEKKEVERELKNAKRRKEKYEELLSKQESGELKQIVESLEGNKELQKRIGETNKSIETLRKKLRTKKRRLREEKTYDDQVINVLAKAVNGVPCPTCGDRISTDKAKKRLEKNKCPHCKQKSDLSELKESLEEKVEKSEEKIKLLQDEIKEMQKKRKKKKQNLEELKEGKDEISGLDSFTDTQLRKFDYDAAKAAEHAESEIESLEESIEEKEEAFSELKTRDNELSSKLETYQEANSAIMSHLRELKQEALEEEIQEFADEWSNTLDSITEEDFYNDISISDDGNVYVPGRGSPRQYPEGYGSAEIRLMNISFSITLCRILSQEGEGLETLFLDEPLQGIDELNSESFLSYAENSDIQFIITTTEQNIAEKIGKTKELTRQAIQADLTDF